jgi:hypothetical protein
VGVDDSSEVEKIGDVSGNITGGFYIAREKLKAAVRS